MSNSSSGESLRPLTLVTGGAGFLGSHLCDRLLAEGHDVICLDNLITGRRENFQHLLSQPHFRFVLHDVTRPIDFPALLTSSPGQPPFSSRRLSYILHFASPASPKDYARHPIHTLKVGALGTYHALGLAKAHGSVFLLASTSEIYGDPEISPQPERYWGHVNPIGPRSVYDEAKRFAEAISMAYRREHGVKVRIVRIFNTYGERMRLEDGRALPNFMVQALLGQPLTVYGKGSQTRSLCYVSDLVEGLYRLLLSNETGPINLGNPEEVSILQLAEAILRATQSNSSIVFEPLPEDDPQRRQPDITAAREKLGWQPHVSLEQGLAKTLPYFQSSLDNLPKTAAVVDDGTP
ncbi:MAG TPA: UDP-glucuronic acid decarboxylase family protein [Terriglobia bacterium]|nr:UDP-glucuronic acid decarboxylase family protein [Terriglobia bacterium]